MGCKSHCLLPWEGRCLLFQNASVCSRCIRLVSIFKLELAPILSKTPKSWNSWGKKTGGYFSYTAILWKSPKSNHFRFHFHFEINLRSHKKNQQETRGNGSKTSLVSSSSLSNWWCLWPTMLIYCSSRFSLSTLTARKTDLSHQCIFWPNNNRLS